MGADAKKRKFTTAEVRKLDDAPTPMQGTPVARISRLTGAVTRRVTPLVQNRRNLWLVVAFCIELAAALVTFILLSEERAHHVVEPEPDSR
jgi:hypothetical protein